MDGGLPLNQNTCTKDDELMSHTRFKIDALTALSYRILLCCLENTKNTLNCRSESCVRSSQYSLDMVESAKLADAISIKWFHFLIWE